MNRSLLAQQMITIAKGAGDIILDIYKDESAFQVEAKADNSPLTIADKNANEFICKGLDNLEVKYPIISEENKTVPYTDRKSYNQFWLVDPLDGTKEFIKRNGEFTVNIALIEAGSPVLGVVYAPALDEMYWAAKGIGAFQVIEGENIPIKAAEFMLTDSKLRVVCSRSHINEATQNYMDQLNEPEKVAKGSSLKFLILAKGEADLYPRLGPTMEWDTGAAQIILEEAGGKVLRADTNEALTYNKENLLNPFFVASGKVLEN